jgi:hypothetical protein
MLSSLGLHGLCSHASFPSFLPSNPHKRQLQHTLLAAAFPHLGDHLGIPSSMFQHNLQKYLDNSFVTVPLGKIKQIQTDA